MFQTAPGVVSTIVDAFASVCEGKQKEGKEGPEPLSRCCFRRFQNSWIWRSPQTCLPASSGFFKSEVSANPTFHGTCGSNVASLCHWHRFHCSLQPLDPSYPSTLPPLPFLCLSMQELQTKRPPQPQPQPQPEPQSSMSHDSKLGKDSFFGKPSGSSTESEPDALTELQHKYGLPSGSGSSYKR